MSEQELQDIARNREDKIRELENAVRGLADAQRGNEDEESHHKRIGQLRYEIASLEE